MSSDVRFSRSFLIDGVEAAVRNFLIGDVDAAISQPISSHSRYINMSSKMGTNCVLYQGNRSPRCLLSEYCILHPTVKSFNVIVDNDANGRSWTIHVFRYATLGQCPVTTIQHSCPIHDDLSSGGRDWLEPHCCDALNIAPSVCIQLTKLVQVANVGSIKKWEVHQPITTNQRPNRSAPYIFSLTGRPVRCVMVGWHAPTSPCCPNLRFWPRNSKKSAFSKQMSLSPCHLTGQLYTDAQVHRFAGDQAFVDCDSYSDFIAVVVLTIVVCHHAPA